MMSWAYVAGFFDGEGNVRFDFSGRNCRRFVFYQSKPFVLEKIKEFLATAGIRSTLRRSSTSISGKSMHTLTVSKMENLLAFANATLPYLRVKKSAVQDFVRFVKMFPALTPSQYGNLAWENRDKVMSAIRNHYAIHPQKGGRR